MNTFINADSIIGRMQSVTEEARTIIDHVEAEYFQTAEPTDETMQNIRTDYKKVGKMLRAALTLLQLAEEANDKWQSRPAEQIQTERV